MKNKRFIAALMTLAFVLALLPAAGAADPAPVVRDGEDEPTLDSVLNVDNGALHFISYGETPFVPTEGEGRTYAVSTVGSAQTGYSAVYFSLFMEYNSALRFEFNADLSNDSGFSVYVNGERPLYDSGLEGAAYNGWVEYVFVAPSSASYTFELIVERHYSTGSSVVKLDNFEYVLDPADPDLTQAVNADETVAGIFGFGTHGCSVASSGGRTYARTNVGGPANAVSSLSTDMIYIKNGDEISFDYCVMPGAAGDYSLIRVGLSILPIYSEQADGQWHTYTETIFDADQFRLMWTYYKGASAGGSGCIMVDNLRINRYQPVSMDEALNVEGGELTFTSGGDMPFEPINYGGRAYAHMDAGAGFIDTTVHMQANSALAFETQIILSWINTGLYFVVNGEDEHYFDTHEAVDGWISYVFIAPAEGDYSFRWQANCAVSGTINLDNIQYIPNPGDADVSAAANVQGGELTFVAYGSNGFVPEQDGDRNCLRSYAGVSRYVTSVLSTLYLDLSAGDTVSFDYYADSRSAWDRFEFCANGERVFYAPCHDTDYCWHTYTYTVETAGRYIFTWCFRKNIPTYGDPTWMLLDNVSIGHGGGHTATLDEALNAEGGDLHFDVTNGTFDTEELFGRCYAVAGLDQHIGINTLSLTVQMTKNQLISFEYDHLGHEYNYGITFKVNGVQQFTTQHYNGDSLNTWTLHTFVAPQNGTYTLSWECWVPIYDSTSVDHPLHFRIDNVRLGAPYDASLGDALNVADGNIRFFTYGRDLFSAQSDDSGSYAVCSTDNYSCSASLRTEYVELEAGQSLSFDYEIYGSDHFDIWFGVNDQYDMDFLGYGIQPGRYHYIFTAPANGSYSFEWGFSKSGNGQTWCRIDNVAVGWEVPVGSGDVDGSGDVTAVDALYVLRYSLGLMELMPWELEEAEVTGDGEVTAADALLILRVALGIITL